MRAARWHARKDVRVEDVEDAPAPAEGEVRVAVEWCGICGTDVEEYTSGPLIVPTEPHPLTGHSAPMIIGHEVSARVIDIGGGVKSLEEGQLVALDGFLTCGTCWSCTRHHVNRCSVWGHIGMSYPGGLAERMTVPAGMVAVAPSEVPSDELALAEPFSVAVRAIRRSRLSLGETVVVLGGGTIGLTVLQVARAAGSGPVTVVEPNEFRRQKALALGACAASATCEELIDVHGRPDADVVIDCTGSVMTPAFFVQLARPGGRIVLVSLPVEPAKIDLLEFVLREVELIGSVGHVYDEDFRTAVDLIASRRVDARSLITSRLPLEQTVSHGFAALSGPDTAETLKILITPKAA